MAPSKTVVLKGIALFTALYIGVLYLLTILYRIGGGLNHVDHVNAFAVGISAIVVGTRIARKRGCVFTRQEYIGIVLGSFIVDLAFQIFIVYSMQGLSFVLRNWFAVLFVGVAHLIILVCCYSSRMISRLLPKQA